MALKNRVKMARLIGGFDRPFSSKINPLKHESLILIESALEPRSVHKLNLSHRIALEVGRSRTCLRYYWATDI